MSNYGKRYDILQGSGWAPAHERKSKLTPRDRDIIRQLFVETPATRRELALAFEVSMQTIRTGTPSGPKPV
jgi:DNA-directed RNA polymerase sigma subunit (sigma70/sigma32)